MCKFCNIKPIYEFTNKRKLCGNCFIRYFHKKFLYTIRKFKMIKIGDIVYCEDFVLKDLLNLFVDKGIIEVTKNKKKANKIAISDNIDFSAINIIKNIINKSENDMKNIKPIEGKIIKPLYLFLDKEILLYAKLRKLKGGDKKIREDKISKFINDLEKKHPEVKRAIINSYLELYN